MTQTPVSTAWQSSVCAMMNIQWQRLLPLSIEIMATALEEVLKDRRISFDTKLEIGYDLIDRLDNAGNTDI